MDENQGWTGTKFQAGKSHTHPGHPIHPQQIVKHLAYLYDRHIKRSKSLVGAVENKWMSLGASSPWRPTPQLPDPVIWHGDESMSALSSVTQPDRNTISDVSINCTAGPVTQTPRAGKSVIRTVRTSADFHYWFISMGLASSVSRYYFVSDFKEKPGLVSSGHKNLECVWFGYA